jgi:hypothetical protein
MLNKKQKIVLQAIPVAKFNEGDMEFACVVVFVIVLVAATVDVVGAAAVAAAEPFIQRPPKQTCPGPKKESQSPVPTHVAFLKHALPPLAIFALLTTPVFA